MSTRKNSISTYNFKTLKVNDTFIVSNKKLISMKNSLRSYNQRHELSMSVEYAPAENEGEIICTRTA